jgi:calcineurin-like phosphoesterase family protein
VIWFTSDTHFGHAKAIEHGRPFKDIQEMAEIMVARWNKVVNPDDEVWHLGDVAMGQREEVLAKYMPRLNGEMHLICGNHDYVGHLHKHKSAEKKAHWEAVYRRYFKTIRSSVTMILPCGITVHCEHLPFVGDHEGTVPRFLDQRPTEFRYPLLHGHVHDSWLVRKEENLPTMVNVGVDMWNFTPVSEEQLEEWLKD